MPPKFTRKRKSPSTKRRPARRVQKAPRLNKPINMNPLNLKLPYHYLSDDEKLEYMHKNNGILVNSKFTAAVHDTYTKFLQSKQ